MNSFLRSSLLISFLFQFYLVFSHEGEKLKSAVFMENKGQWHKAIQFKAEVNGAELYLEKNAFHYQFIHYPEMAHGQAIPGKKQEISGHIFKARFLNANAEVEISKKHASSEYYNFYLGNKPENWANKVRKYEQVNYANLYEGIDLNLYMADGFLKYDYIVAPEINPSRIQVKYEGVDQPKISKGKLIVKHKLGELIEEQPYAYQVIDDIIVPVPCEYLLKENTLSFSFPEGYDVKKELIIDPVLIFSTYSGSAAGNFGMTATYDSLGNGYMGGVIFSNGYDTTLGAFSRSYNGGQSDITISKFSSDGTQLLYGTYLGGQFSETVHSMVVDDNLHLIIMGVSSSANFPVTPNGYDTSKSTSTSIDLSVLSERFTSGPDLVITKFSEDGTSLLGSTFFGGNEADGLNLFISNLATINSGLIFNYGDQFRGEIVVDSLNNIYIGTSTYSTDLGSGTDTLNGLQDGILAKFSPDLSNLIWSKYIGGSQDDAIYSMKVLDNGNLLIGGGTRSFSDFPVTANSYMDTTVTSLNRSDGFISIISADGQSILKSTFIGTPKYDQVYFVESDRYGGVYGFGQTEQGLFPIKNSKIANPGSGQFIVKLDPNLDSLEYSTTFGDGGSNGHVNISPTAFLVDQCQNVYISGWGGGFSNNKILNNQMPLTINAYRRFTNNQDFYLYVMERDADSIIYASFFGGTLSGDHVDGGTSRFDKRGVIYQSVCASCTGAISPGINDTLSDFPTTPTAYASRKYTPIGGNDCNNALFKFDFEILPHARIKTTKTVVCAPESVNIKDLSTNAAEIVWNFYGTETRTFNLDTTILFDTPGFYKISQIATDTICNSSDYTEIIIEVRPNNVVLIPTPDLITCDTSLQFLAIRSNGTARKFIWSTSPLFTDTLNNLLDSTLAVRASVTNKTYYIWAFDTLTFCGKKDTVNVRYRPLFAAATPSQDTICEQAFVTFTSSFIGAQHFKWDFDNGKTDTVNTQPTVFYNIPGNYQIKAIVWNDECPERDTAFIDLYVTPNILSLDTLSDSTYCGLDDLVIFPNSFGTAQEFLWSTSSAHTDTLNAFPFDSSLVISSNSSGNFFLKLTDQFCKLEAEIFLQYVKYQLDLDQLPDSLCAPAQIQLNSTQIGVNSFKFEFGDGTSESILEDPNKQYADSGTYVIQLIGSNLTCQIFDTITRILRVEPQVILEPLSDSTICFSDSISLVGRSNGTAQHFVWSEFSDFSLPLNLPADSTLLVYPGYPFTNFFIKATRSICSDSSQVRIATELADLSLLDLYSICLNDSLDISAVINNGNPTQFIWSPSDSLISGQNSTNIRISPKSSQFFYLNSSTAIGCSDFDSTFVDVNLPSFTDADILTEFDSIYKGQQIQLSTNRNTGNLSYFWEPNIGISSQTAAMPFIDPKQTTTYKVTITDNNTGCTTVSYRTIYVFEINCGEPLIFVPSAFTPNNDQNNDILFVRGEFIKEMDFQVFNRWGQKVFEAQDPNLGWDGIFEGKAADPGVFVYQLNATCFDGQTFIKKGNVTLIR